MSEHLRHRLPLRNGWRVWREAELRSAGFSTDWLEGLDAPELATAIDRRLQELAPLERIAVEQADALSLVQQRTSERLREIGQDRVFREAITWQNRSALQRGIDSLLRRPEGTRANSRDRQNELLVASYLQRYCCKNERIGFFGASAPAHLDDGDQAITLQHGPELILHRSTFLEPWAIDALADRLTEDEELRRLLAPRLLPSLRLEGDSLYGPTGSRTALPPRVAHLLAACDGYQTAQRLADKLTTGPEPLFATSDELYALLAELCAEGALLWRLEVPTKGDAPERLLARELTAIAPSSARSRAEAALAELLDARQAVHHAAGDVERLNDSMANLERVFVRLTGREGTRSAGETYAGRTLVGLDCTRHVDVTIGRPVLDRIAGPLELVLSSARWYTHEIARHYRATLEGLYRELGGAQGGVVEVSHLLARLPELFPRRGVSTIVQQVATALSERWARILDVTPGARRIERTTEALASLVRKEFAAPGPGWPAARHHSPDILLAARSMQDLERGDYVAVLGELHAGMCSLLLPEVPNSWRDPDAPFALRDLDIATVGIAPVWSRNRTRLDYFSRSPKDFDLELSAARSWRPREQVLRLSELVLEEQRGQLVVRSRDHRTRFDIIAFLEHYLIAASFSHFGLLCGETAPRVTVDGVVLVRARWMFPIDELRFAHADTAGERFIGARAWAARHQLPRRCFIKVPEETKPLYVDLKTPVFVELAAKMMRKSKRVMVTEMLPEIDELWLSDCAGRHYTSELRIVAVDPEPWREP